MKLSAAELEIMEQIWAQNAPVTAADLTGPLADKGWKPTTLLTFLSRLVTKKALRVEKQGKQNLYTACISGQEYRAGKAKQMLSQFYDGSVKSMVAALYQNEALTGEELKELQDWLQTR